MTILIKNICNLPIQVWAVLLPHENFSHLAQVYNFRTCRRKQSTNFPTHLLSRYKNHARFVFCTFFGTALHARARRHCESSRRSAKRYPGVKSVLFMVPDFRIASKYGSSPPEQTRLDNITSQPWSDATCPRTTAFSILFCLSDNKTVKKQN